MEFSSRSVDFPKIMRPASKREGVFYLPLWQGDHSNMSQRKEKTLTWDYTISSWRVDLFSGAASLCEVFIDAGRCQETMGGQRICSVI